MITATANNIPSTQDLINNATQQDRYNKDWEASQAQKQMAFQDKSNATAMKFSAQQSQLNRDFQERLSNTAHQREVQDLIKAGLNPVLSAKYSGSSTPSGASATGVSSAGSKGNTDGSMINMFSGLVQALISQATALSATSMNNETSLKATQMMNETAIKTGQITAGAMLGTANINSQTNYGIQKQQQAFEEYMKQNYPQNTVGAASSVFQSVLDMLEKNPNNAKGQKDKAGDMEDIKRFMKWLKKDK